jgi:CheY-like chemotaxis protein
MNVIASLRILRRLSMLVRPVGRQQPELNQLPNIAMTASSMVCNRDKAIEAGMNDHIGKPGKFDELFATRAPWIQIRPSKRRCLSD